MKKVVLYVVLSFLLTTFGYTQNFWRQTNGTYGGTINSSGNVFARSDGSVVDTYSVSKVNKRVGSGNYYLVIRHRNHLGVMSSNATMVTSSSTQYNFTTLQTQAYGTNAMINLSRGVYGLLYCLGLNPGTKLNK